MTYLMPGHDDMQVMHWHQRTQLAHLKHFSSHAELSLSCWSWELQDALLFHLQCTQSTGRGEQQTALQLLSADTRCYPSLPLGYCQFGACGQHVVEHRHLGLLLRIGCYKLLCQEILLYCVLLASPVVLSCFSVHRQSMFSWRDNDLLIC